MQLVLYQKNFNTYLNSFTLFFQLPVEIRDLIFEHLLVIASGSTFADFFTIPIKNMFSQCLQTSKYFMSNSSRDIFKKEIRTHMKNRIMFTTFNFNTLRTRSFNVYGEEMFHYSA